MANTFGTDILIQVEDPQKAVRFYTTILGFKVSDPNLDMVALHGPHISLFIQPGPKLGPVLEVTVANVGVARQKLVEHGCVIVRDEPEVPRCYVHDPFGLTYNLTSSDARLLLQGPTSEVQRCDSVAQQATSRFQVSKPTARAIQF